PEAERWVTGSVHATGAAARRQNTLFGVDLGVDRDRAVGSHSAVGEHPAVGRDRVLEPAFLAPADLAFGAANERARIRLAGAGQRIARRARRAAHAAALLGGAASVPRIADLARSARRRRADVLDALSVTAGLSRRALERRA